MYGAIFTAIGSIVKFLWPLLLAILIFFLGYNFKASECEKAKEKRDIEIAQQIGQVNLEANMRIATIQNELTLTKQKIEENNSVNQKTIADISTNAGKLLADRVRREQANCSKRALSNNTSTTAGSNDTRVTRTRTFLESNGESLIRELKLCDEIVESTRACRTWITDISKQQFNK